MGRINYYLNGVDIRDFGVHVSSGKGLLSLPDRKEGIAHSYDDEHGISVDVSAGYVKERKITLSCFTDKMSATDFISAVNTFKLYLIDAGIFQLKVDVGAGKPLVYMVYWSGKSDITNSYDASKCVGTFDINLVEPEPMKMVFEVVAGEAGVTATLSVPSGAGRRYTVYWGDGSVTDGVADGDTETHTYTLAGKYYAVIAGDVDGNASVSVPHTSGSRTTATKIWSRLL